MLILAADLHVRPGTPSEEKFVQFLEWIGTTPHDVAFLGDVLELWIALPGYEDELAGRFLAWCASEKKNRKIYLVEGNHEFFVRRNHAGCFTEISSEELLLDGGRLLVAHGDGKLCSSMTHRLFRCFSRSWLCRCLLRFFPGAHGIVARIKRGFEKAGERRGYVSPEDKLRLWGKRLFGEMPELKTAVLGHFHHSLMIEMENTGDGRSIRVLPAWKDEGIFAFYDSGKCVLSSENCEIN